MLLFQDGRYILAIAIALLLGITFHEFTHAFVADQLGDHRPRAMGRVSLNPLAHLDPMGTIFFAIAGFGWGKPVLVNPAALRGRGMALVAAGGPVANLVVATVVAIVVRILLLTDLDLGSVVGIVQLVVVFNIALAIFNLLPIPPLDGYNLALGLLPPRYAWTLQQYSQYGFLVLLALILLSYGPVRGPIDWIFDAAFGGAELLTGRPVFL